MISTLDRYILKELVVPFLIGTVSVVLMFTANTVIVYAKDLFAKDVPWSAIGQVLLFSVPSTLKLTLPVGTTIAASLAMSRLVRESELSAMRAAGVPIRRVLVAVAILGVLAAVLSFVLVERVVPYTEVRFRDTLRKIYVSAEGIGVRSNVVLKLDDGRYHVSIGVIQKTTGAIQLNNVLVFHQPKRGEHWFGMAEKGVYKDGVLTLESPYIWNFQGTRLIQFEVRDTYMITQRISVEAFFGTPEPEEQNAEELKRTAEDLRMRGLVEDARKYEVEFHNRYAIPFACFVFAVFAPVFAIKFARGGAFVGVMMSIVTVFVYYNVWVLCSQFLGRGGYLPPVVGAWLPNALFLVSALVALWKSE